MCLLCTCIAHVRPTNACLPFILCCVAPPCVSCWQARTIRHHTQHTTHALTIHKTRLQTYTHTIQTTHPPPHTIHTNKTGIKARASSSSSSSSYYYYLTGGTTSLGTAALKFGDDVFALVTSLPRTIRTLKWALQAAAGYKKLQAAWGVTGGGASGSSGSGINLESCEAYNQQLSRLHDYYAQVSWLASVCCFFFLVCLLFRGWFVFLFLLCATNKQAHQKQYKQYKPTHPTTHHPTTAQKQNKATD